MTAPRQLGNLAQQVVTEIVQELGRQEDIVFMAMSKLALNEDKEAVAEMGRLRDRQRVLKEASIMLLTSNFRGALDALQEID